MTWKYQRERALLKKNSSWITAIVGLYQLFLTGVGLGLLMHALVLPHNTSSEIFTRVLPCNLDGVAHFRFSICLM